MLLINTVNNKEIDFDGEKILLSERESSGIDAEHSLSSGNHDGAIYMGGRLRERNMSLVGSLNINPTWFQTEKRKLNSTVNPLHLVRVIHENCIIEGYPVSTVKFAYNDEENVAGLYKFVIDIVCPNPFWKDIVIGDQISTWIGGWKFKFKLPFKFKQKGEPKKNIFNDGHVETPVEIIFKGPAVNPKVLNSTTGEFIKVDRTLTSDDTLYITTEFGNKKVEIERDGVRANAFNYIDLDSTFFKLKVGDNTIEYSTQNELEPQSVEIRYRNRYLGV